MDLYSFLLPSYSIDYAMTDISDELQFYFDLSINFTNITSQSINVNLVNKLTDKSIQKLKISDKNVIKFTESKQNLKLFNNLNDKYELIWNIKENNRKGIIFFDYPLIFIVC